MNTETSPTPSSSPTSPNRLAKKLDRPSQAPAASAESALPSRLVSGCEPSRQATKLEETGQANLNRALNNAILHAERGEPRLAAKWLKAYLTSKYRKRGIRVAGHNFLNDTLVMRDHFPAQSAPLLLEVALDALGLP
jgi:hypothetical protein